jgi:hypothetical protein
MWKTNFKGIMQLTQKIYFLLPEETLLLHWGRGETFLQMTINYKIKEKTKNCVYKKFKFSVGQGYMQKGKVWMYVC